MRKVFHILFLFCAMAIAADAQNINIRRIVQTNDVTTAGRNQRDISFFRAENVLYDIYVRNGANAISLTNASFAVWYAGDLITDLLYIVKTGTIQNATNGQVRFELTPSESNFTEGQYESIVRLYRTSGGATNEIGTVARSPLEVFWSPDATSYSYNGPYAVTTLVFNIGSTGTPLYAETDPIWLAASTNYYTKTQADAQYVNEGQTNAITTVMITNEAVTAAKLLDGATLLEIADDDGAGSGLDADLLDGLNSSVFATGTPLYVEADTLGTTMLRGNQASTNLDMNNKSIINVSTSSIGFADGVSFGSADVQNWKNSISTNAADLRYVNENQTDAISTAMITNGAVTSVKIFDGAVISEILDDDGAGSLLDADTLDGIDSLAFVQTNSPSATNYLPKTGGSMSGNLTMENATLIYLIDQNQTNFLGAMSNSPVWNGSTMWVSTNDGAGSTLDADLLDGLNSSAFATGTPVYVEADPVWVAASTGYWTKTQADAQYVNEGQTDAINSVMITNDAVTTTKILDGAIINADVNVNAAIAATKIANTALVQTTTFGGDVTGTFNDIQIAAGVVGATELADGTTLSEIADDDGAGSGLDADLLDGLEASAFATGTPLYVYSETDTLYQVTVRGNFSAADILPASNDVYALGSLGLPWSELYLATNSLHLGENLRLSSPALNTFRVYNEVYEEISTNGYFDANIGGWSGGCAPDCVWTNGSMLLPPGEACGCNMTFVSALLTNATDYFKITYEYTVVGTYTGSYLMTTFDDFSTWVNVPLNPSLHRVVHKGSFAVNTGDMRFGGQYINDDHGENLLLHRVIIERLTSTNLLDITFLTNGVLLSANSLGVTSGTFHVLSSLTDFHGGSLTNVATNSIYFTDGVGFGSAQVQSWNTSAANAVTKNQSANYNFGPPANINTPFTNSATWRIIEGTYGMNGAPAANAEIAFFVGTTAATTRYHSARHSDPNLDRRPFRIELPPNYVGLWTNISTGTATTTVEDVRWRNL